MSKTINNQLICKEKCSSNNLMPISDEVRKAILLKENNIIVTNKKELKELIIESLSDTSINKNLHLGMIQDKVIARIKNEIADIKEDKISELFKDNINYALTINQKEIRHIKKDCLTIDDVTNFITTVEDLIINFDIVRYTLYNNSQKALRFRKNMDDGIHIALVVISNKNHTFRVHTIFLDNNDFQNKKRNIFPTLNESCDSLSKTS